ncbi:TolC family protein [Maribacter polysiphoniae]|uniref:Outer membrane protein TolC n=1 Tax=Maribacter polysiphoniae TaxID=429344 RepID=A0A316E7L0_9FLAO|nr:TolC family protein [Maribacter polysiphoniae]MBD1260169.1 TolC family protein [Maribacter polysiphoniae]PWK25628.1 outer membrane protein TolC [Maribacter polysiphoniae]
MRNINMVICLLFVSAFAKAQQLQSFISEAVANSPEIKAYNLRHNIAEEKVNEADWIPNTEFSAGYFVSEPETRTGAQRARFSARQMLPWFGTITARENYASAMADSEYVEVVIARRKLALAVSQSYYRLYSIKEKQKVLDENIQLLKNYEKLALTSVEVGKASAVDVLRLQIRQNELQQQKEVLDEGYLGEQTSLNKFLNRDGNTEVVILEKLMLPHEDGVFAEDALTLNPELLKYDKLYESVVQSEELNQAERNPMIGFGLDYVPVSERPDMSFSDNGKDIFMPMVSVSVPLFNNKYKSTSKQNELRQLEITSQKDKRQNVLESAFAQAISQRNQARIKYNTQEKNLKQANDAEEILIKNYETGTIDFNDVLDIQELQLKFQINQISAITTYYAQSAVVNYLITQ